MQRGCGKGNKVSGGPMTTDAEPEQGETWTEKSTNRACTVVSVENSFPPAKPLEEVYVRFRFDDDPAVQTISLTEFSRRFETR